MNSSVIVGYDGSKSSTEAVMWAADEATMRGVTLVIRTSCNVPAAGNLAGGGWLAGETLAVARTAASQLSDDVRQQVAAAFPELALTAEVEIGPPGSVLVDGLAGGDLLVVGASGQTGIAAFLLGSTARSVVRNSPCPVAVVRGSASQFPPDRIVVGIDGSAASAAAITWAADEADRVGTPLIVVHTWVYAYFGTDGYNATARDLTRVDAACVLDRAVEIARERCAVAVIGELVEAGPSTGLLEYVRDGDLLVLGSRGRGAVRSGLFGSTVNSVIEHAAIPVVVVHATTCH